MYCPSCGNKNTEDAEYCSNCGKNLKKISVNSQKRYSLSLFIQRFLALFLDYYIGASILFTLWYVLISEEPNIFIVYFFWVLYIIISVQFFGTTLGKWLFGLYVESADNKKLSFIQIIKRTLGYFISGAVFSIGFIVALFNSEGKTWHDKIAHTKVVKEKPPHPLIITLLAILIIAATWWVYSIEDNLEDSVFPNLNITGRLQPDSAFLDSLTAPALQSLNAVVMVVCGENQGSGTLVTEEGLILTNYHVIEGYEDGLCEIGFTENISEPPKLKYYAKIFNIVDPSGRPIMITEPDLDVALLEVMATIDPNDVLPTVWPSAPMGSSDLLQIGDEVHIAGYPGFGFGTITVTEGSISGRNGDFLKVSAKLDQGNSGGALFNNSGELIGIPSMGAFGAFEGLGYALSIDSVKYWLSLSGEDDYAESSDWVSFNAKEGFSARFPVTPERIVNGDIVMYGAESNGLSYSVVLSDVTSEKLPYGKEEATFREIVTDRGPNVRTEIVKTDFLPESRTPSIVSKHWHDDTKMFSERWQIYFNTRLLVVNVSGEQTRQTLIESEFQKFFSGLNFSE